VLTKKIGTLEFLIFMVTINLGRKKENRPRGAGSSQRAANGVLKHLLAGHPMDDRRRSRKKGFDRQL
jgi:hypothetical protein